MYKCKGSDGVLQFSDKPCSGVVLQKPDDSSKSQGSSRKSAVGNINEVKLASDGLALIRKDGFGPYKLSEIKAQFLKGKKVAKKIVYPGVPYNPDGSHYFTVETDTDSVVVAYVVEGSNYNVFSSPEQEILNDKKNGEYSTHFDITMMDVNRHAVTIGLNDQTKVASSRASEGVRWKWESDGFSCELDVSVVSFVTPHHLLYMCTSHS
jgi:hypothetical protein